MLRSLPLLLLLAPLLGTAAPRTEPLPPPGDPWAHWVPLLGRWEGVGSGTPGEATGAFTLEKELGGHVLVRRNRAQVAAQAGKPASTHEDLMVIHPEGAGTRAEYYDNEGHVLHYTVRFMGPTQVVFVSDAPPGSPTFRLSYRWEKAGEMSVTFEVAPPRTPDAFRPYLSARVRRVGA